jgi:4-hydroxythreonine-4-phosphate dehydrogenase
MSSLLIACTMGDPAGVGPETMLRAAGELQSDSGAAHCLFLGDAATFALYAERMPAIVAPVSVPDVAAAHVAIAAGAPGPFVLDCAPVPPGLQPGRPRDVDSLAALTALRFGAELAQSRAVDGLVTAPLSKHGVAVHEPGFRGHTEFLAARDGHRRPMMLFAAPRAPAATAADIALLTTHLPLASAIAMVRPETVERALRHLDVVWSERFGRRPVIGVAALNPHAGEYGAIGGEEPRLLTPAIHAVREDDIDARGPYPADSIFLQQGLDVILALYHDQGTIMAKRAPWPTVNLTLGLSYVRTSPDHGTAYGLAATGGADASATLAALRLAQQLARALERE